MEPHPNCTARREVWSWPT